MIKILTSLLFATLLSAAQSHFSLTLSKQKVYTEEPVSATLTLTQDPGTAQITKMHFPTLKAKAFKIVPVTKVPENPNRRHYILLPQRPGSITLPPQSIEIAHKDPATYRNIWRTLRTSPVTLTVLPLPTGIHVTGDYRLKSHIDQHSVQANTPVNLTVTIEGGGSLQGIRALHLPLQGPLIFESKAEIRSKIVNGSYLSSYTQRFSIVADKDFTLPTLAWTYLNTQTGLTETLTTPSYQVTVQTPPQKSHLLRDTLLIMAGLLGGVLLSSLLYRLRHRKTPRSDLSRRIQKTKSDQALYRLLLPHANNDAIAEVLKKLEENLAGKVAHTLNRREIAKVLE